MNKRSLSVTILLIAAIILSACSSISLPGITPTAESQTNSANNAVQSKLGLGILKLVNTDLAITADQAGQLLPLWKALRVLSASSSASQLEIAALYDQMQEILTSNQIQAIGELTWNQEDLNALIQQYADRVSPITVGTTAASSSSSSSRSQSMGGGPGGMDMMGGPGGGGPGGGSDMAVLSGMNTGSQTQSTTTASQSQAGAQAKKPSTGTGPNLNVMLAGSVVAYLQSLAA